MSGKNPIPRELSYEGVRAVNPPEVISSKRAPNANDFKYPIGTFWIDTVSEISYQLVKNPGVWGVCTAGTGGDLNVLQAQFGPVVDPIAGSISIIGDNKNIYTFGDDDEAEIQISLEDSITLDSVTTDFLFVPGGGTSSSIGSVTLVAGTATVVHTNIIDNDRIFLSRSSIGGTAGNLTYTIIEDASFTINSSSNTDTSTISYFIVTQLQ